MAFTFGQSDPVGRIYKKDNNKKPSDVIIIQYGMVKREMASIHRAGCRDIKRDAMQHAGSFGGRYVDTTAAMENYLDEEMCHLGYGDGYPWDEVVKVLPCAMDETFKANIREEAVYLASRTEF